MIDVSPSRTLDEALISLRSEEYANKPVTIRIPTGVSDTDAIIIDNRTRVSEVRIEGAPGAVIAHAIPARRGRRMVSLNGTAAAGDAPVIDIQAGATARVVLSGLRLAGTVRVQGSELLMSNTTLDGSTLGTLGAVVGIVVSGGHVALNQSEVASFGGGGISVTDGVLIVDGSTIRSNGRFGTARIGGLSLTGGSATLSDALIESNGYAAETCEPSEEEPEPCIRGGGLRVDMYGHVELRDGTLVRGNAAYEGGSIFITQDTSSETPVRYKLPAPPAHYLVIVGRGVDELALPPASLIDDTFPFECAAGRYGQRPSSTQVAMSIQTTPRCNTSCPAGYHCPVATAEPLLCVNGTYCPRGSSRETNCPAGTYGGQPMLTEVGQCQVCDAGTHCAAGSSAMTPCSPGFFAATNGSAACAHCDPGTFQDEEGTTSCKMCTSGHYCGYGSASPVPCSAGYYASALGLNASSQCLPCPLGSFCIEGTSAPTPCRDGTAGGSEKLESEAGCTPCIAPTSSLAGSVSCDRCAETYYLDPTAPACTSVQCDTQRCAPCPPGTRCVRENVTASFEGFELEQVFVERQHWRLAALSPRTYVCSSAPSTLSTGPTTPCLGGNDAGEDGKGYCAEGHEGPRCELCVQNVSESRRYFDSEQARCVACPSVRDRATIVGAAVGGVVLLIALIVLFLYKLQPPGSLRGLVYSLRRIALLAKNHGLTPKLKILIALYQSIAAIPTVYDIHLSPWYFEQTRLLTWFNINWDVLVVPGACLEFDYSWLSISSFHSRLLLRGTAPFVVIICGVLLKFCQHLIIRILTPVIRRVVRWSIMLSPRHQTWLQRVAKRALAAVDRSSVTGRGPAAQQRSCCYRTMVEILPVVLFILFCFCASVSKGVFSTWDCIGFEGAVVEQSRVIDVVEEQGRVGSVGTRYFLRDDMSIECSADRDREYADIRTSAYVLLAVWPIFVPLLFVLSLLPIRYDLLQKRNTGLVQATEFLHKEYQPQFYFWEPIYIVQRLVIVGFVQLFDGAALMKLQIGLLLTLSYTIALLYFKPYKKSDVHTLAVCAQICLVGVFFASLNIKLYIELSAASDLAAGVTGFSSQRDAELAMIIFNFVSIALFALMTAYKAATTKSPRTLRLVESERAPELSFHEGMRYHVFLSHNWSSGQDQVATIKRQLQLLLPGVAVFLDVDDLDDEAELEGYVADSHAFLIFLSKGYFFSARCLRELDCALAEQKPLVLVHEADLSHGGAPLDSMRAEAESKDRMEVFECVRHRSNWPSQAAPPPAMH